MTANQALVLGVLQGLTEFLPVSSSGHLVLAEKFLRLRIDPLSMQGFNVLLHTGTLLALLLCYREQWVRLLLSAFRGNAAGRRLLLFLIVATVPGAAVGFFFGEAVAFSFSSVRSVSAAFFVTAVILLLAERRRQVLHMEQFRLVHILFVGVAQAVALIPGISRSGITIAAARSLRGERKDALDFSFLLALPIIAGAAVMSLWQMQTGVIALPGGRAMLAGFIGSFVAGVAAIRFMRTFVAKHSLACFSWYLMGASVLLFMF